MKILVLSDSHGCCDNMISLFRRIDCGAVIFLGDTVRDADRLSGATGAMPVYRVRGNCDFFTPDAFDEQITELDGVKILLTHGHLYSVKSGYESLRRTAVAKGVRVALCGHTHARHYEDENGVIIANPGAFCTGSYGILTTGDGITFSFGDYYEQ